jgi:HEAT repeat protein
METNPYSEPRQQTVEEFREEVLHLSDGPGTTTDAKIFSDLERPKVAVVRRIWPTLPLATRRRLVAQMVELGEEQIEYNFSRVLKLALRDEDAQIRATAIGGLWEDQSEDLLAYLLDEALRDDDQLVREAAVRALAHFSQLVVEDEISPRWFTPLRARLLELVRGDESLEIRRRALEALAVYTDDPDVTGEIERAYRATDETIQMSALYAMGRNLDARWFDTVLQEMENPSPGIRFEATRAIGEFSDPRAVPQLIEHLGDDDREVQLAAIGSLGRVGGTAPMNVLRRLASSKDDVVREAAEEALEEATFLSNPLGIDNRITGPNGRG